MAMSHDVRKRAECEVEVPVGSLKLGVEGGSESPRLEIRQLDLPRFNIPLS